MQRGKLGDEVFLQTRTKGVPRPQEGPKNSPAFGQKRGPLLFIKREGIGWCCHGDIWSV